MGAVVINKMYVAALSHKLATFKPVDRTVMVHLPQMVRIPAGTFFMGEDNDRDSRPRTREKVKTFAIGKCLVTNRDWSAFLDVMGREDPYQGSNKETELHPVVRVSFKQAEEYCDFLREATRRPDGSFRKFRLPSETEWEYAARGPNSWIYPWGNDWAGERAVTCFSYSKRISTNPVGSFPLGATKWDPSVELFDMIGNVWQWCSDWHEEYKDFGFLSGRFKILKGSTNIHDFNFPVKASTRINDEPKAQKLNYGLRLAEDLE